MHALLAAACHVPYVYVPHLSVLASRAGSRVRCWGSHIAPSRLLHAPHMSCHVQGHLSASASNALSSLTALEPLEALAVMAAAIDRLVGGAEATACAHVTRALSGMAAYTREAAAHAAMRYTSAMAAVAAPQPQHAAPGGHLHQPPLPLPQPPQEAHAGAAGQDAEAQPPLPPPAHPAPATEPLGGVAARDVVMADRLAGDVQHAAPAMQGPLQGAASAPRGSMDEPIPCTEGA